MNFSLIICTYMRPVPLLTLLKSVAKQTTYPSEILIIDGSTNQETKTVLKANRFDNLKYYKVEEKDRGLTNQRNYGVGRVSEDCEFVCFLDDDTILESDYFEQLLNTYHVKSDALAVGGYITNEVIWKIADEQAQSNHFYYDGWMRTEPSRFRIRKIFGLLPDVVPGFMPSFSHGRSISFLPPSGKVYRAEQLMGGVSSYRKTIFESLRFSSYFDGYGLYEDADFSLRVAKQGKLFVNTNAKLEHFHDASGRPNQYKYGKMVIRNGWYVWRVKYAKPSLKAYFKWHATAFVLTTIRFTNVITTNKKQEALTESLGRVVGWLSLLFNKPNVKR
ncbi:glycosyltransferase [Tamlana agarivorans]|uniref:Glycosyltransferase n=1 Tax=Pseudotamlana agarivorans TaxID=481183 RepID=A0ACC5UCX5_9FLAO|nr:glycosyltransferase family 2 protein [Tamlana agarivorans]MBU2952137.1 glycosyltransferase [Tamlana agarivorans]